MSLLAIGVGGKRLRRRWLGLFTLSLFFALVLLQPACSSTKTPVQVSGTPTGTYAMTLTATSGSVTKSAPFQLTVTP
jgi:hypothetical protein